LVDLDRALGGWHRKELTIIAARPSMGKSALLFSAFRLAARKGTASLIFSMEMPTEMVTRRMLSDAVWNRDTPIPYVKMLRGSLSEIEVARLAAVSPKIEGLPIAIDDQAGLTVSEIRSRAKRHMERLDAAGQRLDVIVIDHLGKIRASDRYAGNKVHEMGEKTAALAEMAKDLNVAVVAAHQLNRGVEGRDNKRPTLADLRDSGNIEEDAETVMFLYRPAYYLERTREDGFEREDARKEKLIACQHDLEVILAKNRNGACQTIEFFIDLPSNVVRDRT
jgi:replicative DNA helicase